MHYRAQQILDVFRSRQLREGGFVDWTDFGSAIVWTSGFIEDEDIRAGLRELIDDGYVIEANAGLILSRKGERTISPAVWTTDQLREELTHFEQELRAAGLSSSTVHTYVDRSERFLRWLDGDYQPGER